MKPKLSIHLLAVLCALASTCTLAQGSFPSKRINILVAAAPGGGLDGAARIIARRMTDDWGQPVVIEHQGGADGLIASRQVAAAAPDGYTMLLQIPSLLLLKHKSQNLGFDPATAFVPLAELARTPSAIAVQSSLPVRSAKELADYCNRAATPCSWGSGQQLSYLSGMRIFSTLGIRKATNVPYKGTAPVISDLLGGHIVVGITSIASPLPHHLTGKLRILAVNAEKRLGQVPDVPTFHEAGIMVPARGSWYGLFAPAGTPPEVVAKVEKVMAALARDEAALAGMRTLGAEPVFGNSRDFTAAFREEGRYLDELVKEYSLN